MKQFNRSLFAVFVAAGLFAIFYLPYHVSLQPSESLSYTFGYNNRAGIVLLLLFLAIGAIWTKGIGIPEILPGASSKISRTTLALALLVVLAGCVTMWILAGRFGGFGESAYEIDRVWLTSQGRVPYVDFEWPFGVSFLYLPLALKALFSLTLFQASYLFWTLNFLLGTVLLYLSVNMIDYPTRSKKSIFLLFFGAGLVSLLLMGTHYTFLRYTLPIFLILYVQKYAHRDGERWQILAVVMALVDTVVLFTISPEVAIAHAFACACILFPSLNHPRRRGLGIYAVLLAGDLLVFGMALKLHVLDTVRASGGGADSLPIVLSPHILFFFLALFVCACYVFRRFTRERVAHRTFDNTLGILVFSLPMMVAALGRCDPEHVLWNGEGVLLASMFYISSHKIAWRAYRAGFAVVFTLMPALTSGFFYVQHFERVVLNTIDEGDTSLMGSVFISLSKRYIASHGDAAAQIRWTDRLTNPGRFRIPAYINFLTLYPLWQGELYAPFSYQPNGLGSYLSSQVDYGHYEGFENANTLLAIQKKIAEMQDRPQKALLLPAGFEDAYCTANVAYKQAQIRLLFSTFYTRPALHNENVRRPVCDYIREHYHLAEAPDRHDFYYGLWIPTQPAIPSKDHR